MKLNSAENMEFPLVEIENGYVVFKLDKEHTPIAYQNRLEELIEECNLTKQEAEEAILTERIRLEIYYSKGSGLFAVDCEAVESGTIYNPYTGELLEDEEYDII